MNAWAELTERVALRRREQIGTLSEAGYQELLAAVRADVTSFVETPQEQALLLVAQAIDRHEAACEGEDLLDDDAFYASRTQRMGRLARDCEAALALDPDCLDASLLAIEAQDEDPDIMLGPLYDLERRADERLAVAGPSDDLWDELALRPVLRVKDAIARTCLDSAHYGLAARKGQEAIQLSPTDALGTRHTCALAYARLEDEAAFEELDVRFSRQGDAWSHLARTILLYKLGRMPAARRALGGYVRLCEGGAYALLRPILVDVYLPDRPIAPPLSFLEATLAVHEADPIICDVPDFVMWAQGQRDVFFSAKAFAEKNDYDR